MTNHHLLPRFRSEQPRRNPHCPTRKHYYAAESDALTALARVRNERISSGEQRSPESHAYPCSLCGGYHLSSTPTGVHDTDFLPAWRNIEETWEQYARRLEKRIKEQRAHILSLHIVGQGGTNREARKKIQQLTIALGRMTERWEAERTHRIALVEKINGRSWWARRRRKGTTP